MIPPGRLGMSGYTGVFPSCAGVSLGIGGVTEAVSVAVATGMGLKVALCEIWGTWVSFAMGAVD